MATTQELIDEHLLYQEGLAITNLPARRKFRRNLQRALEYLWNLRDFHWTLYFTNPVVAEVGGRTYLEVDPGDGMLRLGPHGVVAVDGHQLDWVPRGEMERLYQVSPTAAGTPRVYTDPEITGATNPSPWAIYIYPPLSSVAGHAASISFKYGAPALGDGGDNPSEADSITLFPQQWHRCLLYELAVLYEMRDRGANAQTIAVQRGIVDQNLRNYLATERHGSAAVPHHVPFRASTRRVWR